MERRDFCKLGASVLAAYAAQHPLQTLHAESNPRMAFSSSFRQPRESFGLTQVRFNHPLPDALSGTLYRNGPARFLRGHTRYQHWFDGDGMVHAFKISGHDLTHQAKMVRTDRYVAEEAAGRFLWDGFGTHFDDSLAVSSPDVLNVANISVLPLGEELLALWEAGSAWRVNPQTLDTIGRKVFSPKTDGMPFSAHPRIDPAGRIWNFGYLSGSGKLALYDINLDGRLHRVSLIDAPNADMVHDFAVTERYLVFVLVPLQFKSADRPVAFIDMLHWNADEPVHVLLIDKNNLQVAGRFELPAFFVFHLGNAWEDGNTVRIATAASVDFHPMMDEIVQATTGGRIALPVESGTSEIVLDLQQNHATITAHGDSGIDFPRFDQRYTGMQTDKLFMLGRTQDMSNELFGFNQLVSISRQNQTEQTFDYGPDSLVEEHIFIADETNREAHGWLVGTSYHWLSERTRIALFDAQHIDDGPIAEAELPYGLPLGLHGQFVSAL